MVTRIVWPVLGLGLLAVGSYWGFVVAPPEAFMGEVYRIIYVHVPTVWMSMLGFLVAFVASIIYLMRGSWKADALAEAATEVALFFTAMGLITGSIWAKPTWGVWWSWDPRLTTFAILFFAYAGYMALRQFVDDPEKRATWSAVAAIVIAVDIPIVWYSVKWWNSLHQLQSNSRTMHSDMVIALWLNTFAFLFLAGALVALRYRIGRAQQRVELSEPPELQEAVA